MFSSEEDVVREVCKASRMYLDDLSSNASQLAEQVRTGQLTDAEQIVSDLESLNVKARIRFQDRVTFVSDQFIGIEPSRIAPFFESAAKGFQSATSSEP